MDTSLFLQLAVILGLATVISTALYLLKQPLVAAYIITGVVISFFNLTFLTDQNGPFEFLPTIGVAFLLFLIGIELDLRELKLIGKPIVLAAVGQMAITTSLVALLATVLGFAPMEATLIGLALSFSSTIVIIKLLVDKQEITTLHGRVCIGILLVEDLVAVITLVFLSMSTTVSFTGLASIWPVAILFLKGASLLLFVYLLVKFIMDRLFTILAKGTELLFLAAIAWCFIFIYLAQVSGFSLEIGAFLGGVTLASSPYRYQIAGRLKPLRDFFIAIFFIHLGLNITFSDFVRNFHYVALFSAIAFLVKPAIYIGLLSLLGFRRHTTYHTATGLSQISEFSVILFYAAYQYKFVSQDMVSTMAATTVVTIFFSSILVNQNERLYKYASKVLAVFERSVKKTHVAHKDLTDHIILIGAHRAGSEVLKYLQKKEDESVVVVDYNPEIIENLHDSPITAIFGDVSDPDVLDDLNLGDAKMIISTITELHDNLLILQNCKKLESKAICVMAANDADDAKSLYRDGAHVVVIPMQLEGIHIVRVLADHWDDRSYYYEHQKVKATQ